MRLITHTKTYLYVTMYDIILVGDSIMRGLIWTLFHKDPQCKSISPCASVCGDTALYVAGFHAKDLPCVINAIGSSYSPGSTVIVQTRAHVECDDEKLLAYNRSWIHPLSTFLLTRVPIPTVNWIGPTPQHFSDTGCFVHHGTRNCHPLTPTALHNNRIRDVYMRKLVPQQFIYTPVIDILRDMWYDHPGATRKNNTDCTHYTHRGYSAIWDAVKIRTVLPPLFTRSRSHPQ